jgi:hypothetical protein
MISMGRVSTEYDPMNETTQEKSIHSQPYKNPMQIP